jgi:hypothetical protein
MAVEIPGTLQTDLKVPARKRVVLAPDRFGDGKLVISLEPDF